MALALVATPGAANANAYATEAAALTAASYRIGANPLAFVALTSDQRIQALVTAARDIDSLGDTRDDGWLIDFIGERTDDTQALQFPRSGTDFDDDELPPNLVEANIELAISYAPAFVAGYTGDVLNPDTTTARVKRKKIDVLETEYFAPGPTGTALERFPGMVQRLLASLLDYTQIVGAWGTGEVIRGS